MDIDVEAYRRDGYTVVSQLFTPAEVDGLLAAIQASVPPDEDNELSLGAMQFTSNVFRRSEPVRRLLADERMVELVTRLAGPSAWCRWDQAVRKGPGSATFPWHQDNGYTQLDHEHLQVWIALTDAPEERGGLLVEPGAHRAARAHRWVGSHVEVVEPPVETVVLAAERGDVVAFSSLLPHATAPNQTDQDRWTYVAEFLPLGADDPSVERPHFVVARDARPVGNFEVDRYAPRP